MCSLWLYDRISRPGEVQIQDSDPQNNIYYVLLTSSEFSTLWLIQSKQDLHFKARGYIPLKSILIFSWYCYKAKLDLSGPMSLFHSVEKLLKIASFICLFSVRRITNNTSNPLKNAAKLVWISPLTFKETCSSKYLAQDHTISKWQICHSKLLLCRCFQSPFSYTLCNFSTPPQLFPQTKFYSEKIKRNKQNKTKHHRLCFHKLYEIS